MNYRLYIFILLLLPLSLAIKAQEQIKSNSWAFKAQYVGEFVLHPGFTLGTDYTIKSMNHFTLHWDTEIGGYVHKRNSNSLFLQSTLGMRLTTRFAVFTDIQAGLGYMLSMPQGDVYRVDDAGYLQLKGRPLYSHIKPTISLLFGWDGKLNRDIPLSIFTGLEAYMQSAYNHVMLPHTAFRLGVLFQL